MLTNTTTNDNRIVALLLGGGISILLVRAAILISTAKNFLRRWVIGLAAVELALDIATLGAAIRLCVTKVVGHRALPSRLAAVAIVVHAIRVTIFVLGRFGPFKDFDVRTGQRSDHDSRWSWAGVVFAAAMSVLGVLGVLTVRRNTVKHGRQQADPLAGVTLTG